MSLDYLYCPQMCERRRKVTSDKKAPFFCQYLIYKLIYDFHKIRYRFFYIKNHDHRSIVSGKVSGLL